MARPASPPGSAFANPIYRSLRALSSNGPTPQDFITAIYTGGSSMTILGSSEFGPKTRAFRMLYLLNSLIDMSVLSLTLTYLLQIYTALQSRNGLGLNVYLLTSKTADAASCSPAWVPPASSRADTRRLRNWQTK